VNTFFVMSRLLVGLVNIQGTFREQSRNIQGTFREHSGNVKTTTPNIV
jgi:hypothetical protein